MDEPETGQGFNDAIKRALSGVPMGLNGTRNVFGLARRLGELLTVGRGDLSPSGERSSVELLNLMIDQAKKVKACTHRFDHYSKAWMAGEDPPYSARLSLMTGMMFEEEADEGDHHANERGSEREDRSVMSASVIAGSERGEGERAEGHHVGAKSGKNFADNGENQQDGEESQVRDGDDRDALALSDVHRDSSDQKKHRTSKTKAVPYPVDKKRLTKRSSSDDAGIRRWDCVFRFLLALDSLDAMLGETHSPLGVPGTRDEGDTFPEHREVSKVTIVYIRPEAADIGPLNSILTRAMESQLRRYQDLRIKLIQREIYKSPQEISDLVHKYHNRSSSHVVVFIHSPFYGSWHANSAMVSAALDGVAAILPDIWSIPWNRTRLVRTTEYPSSHLDILMRSSAYAALYSGAAASVALVGGPSVRPSAIRSHLDPNRFIPVTRWFEIVVLQSMVFPNLCFTCFAVGELLGALCPTARIPRPSDIQPFGIVTRTALELLAENRVNDAVLLHNGNDDKEHL
mmetsp:Transcript_10/g.12  ORF Transcript_10/g.12 Transcript_10/m.12 type:complete len:515 (-) Transcript_10:1408-2952(-)